MKSDSIYLQQVRVDDDYDYLREIGDSVSRHVDSVSSQSFNSSFMDRLNDLLSSEFFKTISIIIVTFIICWVIYSILKNKTFLSQDDDIDGETMGNDTIYGHDWDKEFTAFMTSGNYSEAVVLLYLKWLDQLNSDKMIEFDKSKTPGMFIEELNAKAPENECEQLLVKTRALTHHYLRVRYGHRKATAQLVNQLAEL